MKHAKATRHRRLKAFAVAGIALAAGIGLLMLSRMVIASGERAAAEALSAAETARTQPAADSQSDAGTADTSQRSGTATAPAGDPAGPARVPPADPRALTAYRLGGLLLLFSLMCFALVAICAGWIVYDIRRSRPAWMKQTKYPVHEKRK